ncbi:NUDIX hydrolase [Paracoccus sp. TK19116]|uniref:NUDIX hydrolase n=1 Tax=Paracoccus albicereus TaxID=2922394 RepID=A0ABT1MRF6_9RHOB|nr:NUDIX hydrolase [Paracoccus albicereus]MCQ0970888.1 NUDIX hydrolase [Paracoccus albicereus]
MIPRFGQPPEPGRAYRLRPGAYGLLIREGRALLTRRSDDDELQLPGGGIDPGESPPRALAREVFEETGWNIGAPRRIGVYRRFTFMPDYGFWAEKLCHVWIARPLFRRADPIEPLHMPEWVLLKDLPDAVDETGARDFLRLRLRRRSRLAQERW